MTTLNDMTPTTTVRELDETEGQSLFEAACQEHLGVSAAVFLAAKDVEEYPGDWSDRAIQRVEFLLPFAG